MYCDVLLHFQGSSERTAVGDVDEKLARRYHFSLLPLLALSHLFG